MRGFFYCIAYKKVHKCAYAIDSKRKDPVKKTAIALVILTGQSPAFSSGVNHIDPSLDCLTHASARVFRIRLNVMQSPSSTPTSAQQNSAPTQTQPKLPASDQKESSSKETTDKPPPKSS